MRDLTRPATQFTCTSLVSSVAGHPGPSFPRCHMYGANARHTARQRPSGLSRVHPFATRWPDREASSPDVARRSHTVQNTLPGLFKTTPRGLTTIPDTRRRVATRLGMISTRVQTVAGKLRDGCTLPTQFENGGVRCSPVAGRFEAVPLQTAAAQCVSNLSTRGSSKTT